MQTSQPAEHALPAPASLSWKKAAWIIFGALVLGAGLSAAGTLWWVRHHLYASGMNPVSLSEAEQKDLDAKLETFAAAGAPAENHESGPKTDERTLWITAREINAHLAKQGLGETFGVELAQDHLIVTMIAPIPEDSGLPLLAGTTLRVRLSMTLDMDPQQKLRASIGDVRVGGVPLPNAWLGDIKGVNLVHESMDNDPALRRFFAGIREAEVRPEGIRVVLNE